MYRTLMPLQLWAVCVADGPRSLSHASSSAHRLPQLAEAHHAALEAAAVSGRHFQRSSSGGELRKSGSTRSIAASPDVVGAHLSTPPSPEKRAAAAAAAAREPEWILAEGEWGGGPSSGAVGSSMQSSAAPGRPADVLPIAMLG